MGKILYIYGGFSTAQLKSRASIPSQTDITVGANYIECSSVDIPSEIRDAIGEGSNDLGTIYLSAKVNRWSFFSPREWYLSGGVLYDRAKSNPYDMANFCGYNHAAVAPYISSKTDIYHQNVETGIDVTVYVGEIDWVLIGGIAGMGVTSKVGAITYKTSYVSFSIIDYRRFLVIQSQFTLPYLSNQWIDNEVYFINSSNQKVANIPNIATFQTQFIAPPLTMTFGASSYDYQSVIITTPSETWTIVSHPDWINHVVYRNNVLVSGTNSYISGDELRLFPVAYNTGAEKNGIFALSEGIEISIFQQGGNATVTFDSGSIVLSSSSATLSNGSATVPISFHVTSGLGASNVMVWFRLYCNTISAYMGSWQSTLTRDGQTVNATLTGLGGNDIAAGRTYTVYVTNIDPML
ncbi:MAG: hypothetical protein NTX38_19470 [Methylobacter sp.]|nr:hypothetical protein [Methylobacter sp.]